MTLCLFAVAVLSKLSVVLLRLGDGNGSALLSPWLPIALLYQDLALVLVFDVIAWALGRRSPRAIWILYVVLSLWMVVNIPVVRVMSTPLTFSLLHATGGTLEASIAVYVTVLNLGVPLLLGGVVVLLPRTVRTLTPPARLKFASIGLAILLIAMGAPALQRVDTLGIHQNAVWTLLRTTTNRWHSPLSPSAHPAPCPQVQSFFATDLSALRGHGGTRNIVWVILESTGARALTGTGRSVAPHLQDLRRNSLVFDNAYAAYPESIKGLFSILCSRLPPPGTEASDYVSSRYPCPAIADQLAAAGFHTGLFHSGRFSYLGMDAVVEQRGFSRLDDAQTIPSPHRSSFGVDDRSTAQRVLDFVDQVPHGSPFFAVYMPIAGHHPYHAPGNGPRPFSERSVQDEHDNDLFVGDDAFGLLRSGLKARDLDDKTIYVVMGDHGEAFLEHEGNVGHTLFLYEENVRVPLFIAAPGLLKGQRHLERVASLIDVTPTTLDLMGLSIPTAYEGQSLLEPAERPARFFTEQGVRRAGLRDGPYKFLWDQDGGRTQLFDLSKDPRETNDLASLHPDRVLRYQACLRPPAS